MSEKDYKFPNARSFFEFTFTYEREAVDSWLKRCDKDFPYPEISKYPTPETIANDLIGYTVAVKNWHTRWFSQFKKLHSDLNET